MPESDPSDRLPPGQYLTPDLPVLHVGSVPTFDRESWDLRLTGLLETPLTLDHDAFLALPRVESVSDLHCETTWSRYDNRWEGVLLRELVDRARPLPDAGQVHVHCDGGYTTNLPLEALLDDDVLLADRLDGEPLPPEHGFPVRLVVPKRYAWKSAKWVRLIEFLSEDRPGFWESRGYSNTADPWTEDRFA
ncbi:MAG: molybdopterin-dependent oxidoreductase [Planctomycetota bacterium]|jgi:DMSO/TMAO reductase YedYZ molybdopterin-dependent catalytic subunit